MKEKLLLTMASAILDDHIMVVNSFSNITTITTITTI